MKKIFHARPHWSAFTFSISDTECPLLKNAVFARRMRDTRALLWRDYVILSFGPPQHPALAASPRGPATPAGQYPVAPATPWGAVPLTRLGAARAPWQPRPSQGWMPCVYGRDAAVVADGSHGPSAAGVPGGSCCMLFVVR